MSYQNFHHHLKKCLCILFLFTTSSLNAQSMDISEDFLESLDPSIRDSIESSSEQKEKRELEKLFNSDTSIEKNKAILEKLKKQINQLDTRLNEDLDAENNKLEVFGRKFFSSIQSTFMPINIPNFGSNYIIDVGDEFLLMLTGKVNKEHELEVQRDGSLVIPSFGKVNVAGQSIQSASSAIGNLLENTMLGVAHHLTLSNIRDIQVLLLGGIESPGIYTLNGGSNLLHALNVAGGIAENGSFRKVDIIRNSKTIGSYDLYSIFTSGSFDPSATLRSGDSIFVHPRSFLIPTTGGVNQEALYEILPEETLTNLIGFAGGLSPSFNGFGSIKVNSVNLQTSEIKEVSIKDFDLYKLQSRDSVMVPAYENKGLELLSINIEGLVKRPGKYFFQEGDKLSSLIERAGGYTDDAYVYGAALFRKRAIELEKQFSQRNYKDVLSFITLSIGKPGVNINSAAIELLTEEAKAAEYFGRIITDFNLTNILKDPAKDVLLESGDTIVIPPLDKTVYLFGAFSNPSNVSFSAQMKAADYISQAGGLKDTALKTLYVIDPDGIAHIYDVNRLFKRNSIPIYPGTIIYAPKTLVSFKGLNLLVHLLQF